MPPEFIKSSKYDGSQGTVWQMGILLVDMLSPVVTAFEKPHHALSMAPRVPQQFSPGIYQCFFYSIGPSEIIIISSPEATFLRIATSRQCNKSGTFKFNLSNVTNLIGRE